MKHLSFLTMKKNIIALLCVLYAFSAYPRAVTVNVSALQQLKRTARITELCISGDMDSVPTITAEHFPKLKRITFDGDIKHLKEHTFCGFQKLETLEFNGMVAHVDCRCITDCPDLRTVTFSGPIFSTDFGGILSNCPKAEKIVLNGLMSRMALCENENCPNFNGYESNGIILVSFFIPASTQEEILARKEQMMPQLEKLSTFVKQSLASENGKFLFQQVKDYHHRLPWMIYQYKVPELCADWKEQGEFADPDLLLPKLDLLKKSASYTHGSGQEIDFTYALPTDSLLTATRLRFNLDSIAGNGDELSRIKNLLHFVHESVRHDGSAPYPNTAYNFRAFYDLHVKEDPGFNCRLMAIMLTEVLLAEGIPARYLMCQPKYNDGDSHVITVAWSRELNKWIWVDPTFDAWVTDENGVMLGPAEVRERLIADQPLFLNDYANWNHQNQQTVEHYLKEYMAKNLYIMGCCTINQAEPEGKIRSAQTPCGTYVYLAPEGDHYGANPTTHDPDSFWAAPKDKQPIAYP